MTQNQSTVKLMMIQSGLIPENVVRQLVNWRLLPADSVGLTGSHPINMEKEWDDLESFVKDLKSALDEEAKTIRETELDQVGEYRPVSVRVSSDSEDWKSEVLDAFVDRLGRVLLPPKSQFENALSITFLDGGNGANPIKMVERIETRFRGDKVAAYVVYLEE